MRKSPLLLLKTDYHLENLQLFYKVMMEKVLETKVRVFLREMKKL